MQTLRVLLVDDEPRVTRALARLIRPHDISYSGLA